MTLEDVKGLTRTLFNEHAPDWSFRFDNAKRRAGSCHYATQTVTLSCHIMSMRDVKHASDAVLHEIAHARAGRRTGHGSAWRRCARTLGARTEGCYAADLPRVPAAWIGEGPSGHTHDRHRRPKGEASCPQCARGHDSRHPIYWRRRDRATQPADLHTRQAR